MCHLLLFGHDHVSRINRILISIFSFFIFIFRNVKLTVTWLYLIWLYPRVSKTVRFVTNQKIICHRFVTPGWSLYVTIFYSLNKGIKVFCNEKLRSFAFWHFVLFFDHVKNCKQFDTKKLKSDANNLHLLWKVLYHNTTKLQ